MERFFKGDSELIPVKNIYYMLSYAYQTLNMRERVQQNIEGFEYADDLMASILTIGIAQQLKRGLSKDYCSQIEYRISPKGKIRLPDTIRRQINHDNKVVCQVDRYIENTIYNQILKTTCLFLLKSEDVKPSNKRQLKKILLYFSAVDLIEISNISWKRLQYNKNNQSYKMLMNICYLVIKGMLMSEEDGTYKLSRFIDDQRMSALYERFVLNYYKKHYPNLKVHAPQIPWDIEGGVIDLLPKMKSDIVLESNGKTLIIDTKYYEKSLSVNALYGNQTIHSHNLYQIYAYVKNWDKNLTGNVSGMLLYAQSESQVIDNSYNMHGNKISVKTLDLSGDFFCISEQLDKVVENEFSGIEKLRYS